MRTIRALYYFYLKLLIPSIILSFALSYFCMNGRLYAGTGISFIFLTPAFHYFTYEIQSPNEYYFYHNLGLSKLNLWLATVFISISIGFILASI